MRRTLELFVVLFIMLAVCLLMFSRLFDAGQALDAGDAPMWIAHQFKSMLRQGAWSSTNPWMGIGTPGMTPFGDGSMLTYYFLPEAKADEVHMFLGVLFTGLFMYLFLRERGMSWWAGLTGALAVAFSTSFVSLCKAGHLGKIAGIAYLMGALWLMTVAMRRKSVVMGGFAGLLAGYSLAWGRDTSLLVALGVGVFWIQEAVRTWRSEGHGAAVKPLLALALGGVIAGIAAFPMAQFFMGGGEGEQAVIEAPKQQDESWEWATQWSLPPGEAMKLICPSYCGWDSWDPEAPYWGEMGRSAGWEKSHQGFRNFTQTNEYLGLITTLLATVGVLSWFLRRKEAAGGGAASLDVPVWLTIGIVALLLAMGKYFPLYRLFYGLPYMASIRCPVKFMHLVSLSLGVLAAHGVLAIEQALSGPAVERRRVLRVAAAVAGGFAFILLVALVVMPGSRALATRLQADGFANQMQGIRNTMMFGLMTSLFLALGVATVAWVAGTGVCDRVRGGRSAVMGVLALLMLVDLVPANRHYVRYQDWKAIYTSNPILDYLKQQREYRVKFIPLSFGVFNQWNSLLVQYFELRSADVPAASRMAKDLSDFYQTLGSNPARLWLLTGVKNLVVPRQFEGDLKKLLGAQVSTVRSFDFAAGPTGQPVADWAPSLDQGRFLVMHYTEALPVATWFDTARHVDLPAAMAALGDPGFKPADEVLLTTRDPLPSGEAPVAPGPRPRCELVDYSGSRVRVRCSSDRDGWVMINDYFDPAWRATVDGVETPIVRADGIFYAVRVPAGVREIVMNYRGKANTARYPLFCLAGLCVAGVLSVLWGLVRKGRRPSAS